MYADIPNKHGMSLLEECWDSQVILGLGWFFPNRLKYNQPKLVIKVYLL